MHEVQSGRTGTGRPISPRSVSNYGLTMDMKKKNVSVLSFSVLFFLEGREKGPAYKLFFQYNELTVHILLIRTIVCCLLIVQQMPNSSLPFLSNFTLDKFTVRIWFTHTE